MTTPPAVSTAPFAQHAAAGSGVAGGADGDAGRFRLLRYFAIWTLVAFVLVGIVLAVLQHREGVFFAQVQREQAAFFTQAQAELARQHEAAARDSLLANHEAAHVNMTTLVANMMWASDLAPIVAAAQRRAVEPCRALPAPKGDAAALAARRACFAELGRQIRAAPGFAALDAKAYAAMRGTSVFKIKVWDLRGVCIYSSEHAQIGDDASANAGWRSAAAGRPASELTHRDRFSAFEGVVENRDLISSYVPVRLAANGPVLGVFELYSDVTAFLERMKATAQRMGDLSAANDALAQRMANTNQALVDGSSTHLLLIVGALLATLYAASWAIVRNGQRLIDRQHEAQQRWFARERQWHREKMAALATMAANVAHEVGNPLAVISSVVQDLPDDCCRFAAPVKQQVQQQAGRIGAMMRQIADFASVRGREVEWVDVNAMVKAVCDFHAFDQRFRGRPIDFRPQDDLGAHELVPDHLHEAAMQLLQVAGSGAASGGEPLRVQTLRRDGAAVVRAGPLLAAAPEATLDALRRRVAEMGWRLELAGPTIEITMPGPAGAAG